MKFEDYQVVLGLMEHMNDTMYPQEERHHRIGKMNVRTDNNKDDLFPVEVRESPIHGKGVFSTKKIEKGDIITFYPADAVALKIGLKDYKVFSSTYEPLENFMDYAFNVEDDIFIIGNPDKYSASHCGHLINEAYPEANTLDKAPFSFKLLMDVCMRTTHNMNAKFQKKNSNVSIVATKDIEPNTEILLSYGMNYWIKDLNEKIMIDKINNPINEKQKQLLIRYNHMFLNS